MKSPNRQMFSMVLGWLGIVLISVGSLAYGSYIQGNNHVNLYAASVEWIMGIVCIGGVLFESFLS